MVHTSASFLEYLMRGSVSDIADENPWRTYLSNPAEKTTSNFRKIFPALITPSTIENLNSDNARRTPYIKMPGATFQQEGKETISTRTVMVFGKSIDSVRDILETGRQVRVAAQFDGGSVRIIGLCNDDMVEAA